MNFVRVFLFGFYLFQQSIPFTILHKDDDEKLVLKAIVVGKYLSAMRHQTPHGCIFSIIDSFIVFPSIFIWFEL